jgi:hypothetical protein
MDTVTDFLTVVVTVEEKAASMDCELDNELEVQLDENMAAKKVEKPVVE